ncbi:MAG: DUF433 domain-containing protein [Acidobacteriia bacterium]|nr:DUF433 domain-containing protein [Terriglobia bacterium]
METLNLFTPTRAAAVTGLSLKSVQKAIDLNMVPVRRVRVKGIAKRYLADVALLCLRLEAEGLHQLSIQARKDIFRAVTRSPREPQVRFGGVCWVDIPAARKRLAMGLLELRKVEHMVWSDKEILTGTPVFKGTRVPVHSIAEMVNSGTPIAEILEGYPSLTEENVRLAPIYAKAHPLRGRPRTPWKKSKPTKRLRKRLKAA